VATPLHIPPFVNYECTLCGWCCRQYDISFSQDDYDRLSKRDWGKLVPQLEGKAWCEPLRHAKGYARFRLKYSPEGACVFLSPDNKCLMHEHVGELGKTIGCNIFPFTFVAGPTGVYVGCRFSCNAVAYGLGESIVRRETQLRRQLAICRKAGHVPQYADPVHFDGRRTLPWADCLALEGALTRVLLRDDLTMARRLLLFGKFVEIVRDADFEKVRGARFRELVGILEAGLVGEAVKEDLPDPPAALWRVMFRQFCFQFQRRQGGTWHEMSGTQKMMERLRQFWRGVQFVRGRGTASLPAFPGPLPLAGVDDVASPPLTPREELTLSRFMAAKLYGKQYFGQFFFGYPMLDGLVFLLLTGGAVMWYARALALARGAETRDTDDLIEAMRYVDFCYGYSPAPALPTSRAAVRTLSRRDLALRLVTSQFSRDTL